MSDRPHVLIVVASTRPGRNGGLIGDWVATELADDEELSVEVADLAEIGLPLLDEPNHPSDRKYTRDHTFRWSAAVERADAFVFVTPEYNRGMPAALKNALDYLYWEWRHKPAAFVSYAGGVSGGTRAVEQVKQTLTTLAMFPIPDMVNLPFVGDLVDDGGFHPPERAATALRRIGQSLAAYVRGTAGLRVAG